MRYLLLNLLTIELGGLLSRPAARALKPRLIDVMKTGAGLCVLLLGIKGAAAGKNDLLLLLSMVLGGLIGTALNLDACFGRLAEKAKRRFNCRDERFAEGLITLFMMQAVGAMAIMGPLNAALLGDPTLLLFKALLDFVSSLVYGTIYGRGVLLSGPLVFIYQSLIFFAARFIAPFLTPRVIGEISAVGSLVLAGLALDMLGILKFKSADFLPALLGPVFYFGIRGLF